MNKEYIRFFYIGLILFLYIYSNDLSLFDKIDQNDVDFLQHISLNITLEKQESLLRQVNVHRQTPLHYALSKKNISASYALITLIKDPNLFFGSDEDENTPWWLAQEIPHSNVFTLMQLKIPANFEIVQ